MSTFYIDYDNGNDTWAGDSFAAGHPWKTLTSGATAARIAPNDIIHIAKSPAPVQVAGNTATWTNLSKTVTLGTANTLNIAMCEVDWTAVHAVSSAKIGTDWKEGTYALKCVEDATGAVNEVQAYFATGTLDLSGYQKISFWIKNEVAIADAVTWVINLYTTTDASGAASDSFIIPAIPSTGRWLPLTLAKVGGGNLTNGIKSIAIVNGATTVPTASKYIYLDNIIACTTSGLNLQSLISKNSAEQNGTEGWYGIQSINGTTVLLDNDTNTLANAGRGYSTTGTTPETVNTYYRETIKTALASASSTQVQVIQDSGSLAVGNIQFQGGYNITNDTQDGETFFDGLNGNGYGICSNSRLYVTFNHVGGVRYNRVIYHQAGYYHIIQNSFMSSNTNSGILCDSFFGGFHSIINVIHNNNNSSIAISGANQNTITNCISNNNSYGIDLTSGTINNIVSGCIARNNGAYGIGLYQTSFNKFYNCQTSDNATSGINNGANINYFYNCTIAEATEVLGYTAFANSRIFSQKHDGSANNNWIFTDGGTINSVATDRAGGTGLMYKIAITSANRASNYPLKMSLIKLAVVANKAVTITAYMKRDHASNVGGQIICRGGQLTGIATDVTVSLTDADTNWHQLTLPDVTPTEAGVLEFEVSGWYIAGNSNVYCGEVSIVQAA
jgi:parallel beta-helix repeat protein